MVKHSRDKFIFCSILLFGIVINHVYGELKGHPLFESWLHDLRASAVNPLEPDFFYYGSLRSYGNDFPFQEVILQRVKNRYDKLITIPKYIRAEIRSSHTGKRRSKIPNNIVNYLRDVGREKGDHSGHLLAWSLGGTNDEFNFAPMLACVNTHPSGSHSIWLGEETSMQTFLNSKELNRRIEWELYVEYIIPAIGPHFFYRPEAFHLRHNNYNEYNVLVDNSNNSISKPNPVMRFDNNKNSVKDGCIYSHSEK